MGRWLAQRDGGAVEAGKISAAVVVGRDEPSSPLHRFAVPLPIRDANGEEMK
jgi:hypothetical protein